METTYTIIPRNGEYLVVASDSGGGSRRVVAKYAREGDAVERLRGLREKSGITEHPVAMLSKVRK